MRITQPAPFIWAAPPFARRNVWQMFRREFTLDFPPETASLHITADTRYTLFVNGVRLGSGPMKYFQAHIPYDTYDIAPCLRCGKNVIGVLVHYWGVGTMQHQFGEPGLWLQAIVQGGERRLEIGTGPEFLTAPCAALDSRSPRICVQQAFTEHLDMSRWEDFSAPGYHPDPVRWTPAVPTPRDTAVLFARDIPPLTEEPLLPARVSRLRLVSPPEVSFVVDTRSMMLDAEGYKNCNPATMQGLVVTVIHMEQPGDVVLYLDISRCYPVFFGGRWHTPEELKAAASPHLHIAARLGAGDNRLAFDITAREHWMGVHFALHSEAPFRLRPPEEAGPAASPFLLLGPFSPTLYNVDDVPGIGVDPLHPDYRRAVDRMAYPDGLQGLEHSARPVPPDRVAPCDPVLLFANAREADSACAADYAVPQALQEIVLPGGGWAVLPLQPERDTEFTVDFGRETVGYLAFEADAPAGTILDFYPYEYTDGRVIQHTWGMDPVWRVVCREGRQRFTSFLRRGFRYCAVAVRGASRPVKFRSVSAIQSTYPLAQVGNFSCADRLLTDIWELSAHTVRMCSEDTFVDCPAYEQVFWVGDSRNEALVSRYVYGNTANIRRCLELVPQSASQTPLLCDQVPSMWDSVIPNWTFAWMIACGEQYTYTGDVSFVKGILPAVRAAMEAYLGHLDGRGLLNIEAWNLLDWAPSDQPNAGVVTHQTMFMVKALRELARLSQAAGEDPSPWTARADALRAAINVHLWDGGRQAYLDCIHADGRSSTITSIQTQIVALLCDIPRERERAAAVHRLVLRPPADFVQVCSPFMAFFQYEVLEKAGDVAAMLEDMRIHYGEMVRCGATTCWEQYPESPLNKAVEGMLSRSHCHAWSAAPAYFLSRSVLGVKPLAPFWTSVEIAPVPCGLAWARGAVPHPAGGVIEVSFTVEGDKIDLRISAPEDVELVIRLPDGLKGEPLVERTKRLESRARPPMEKPIHWQMPVVPV